MLRDFLLFILLLSPHCICLQTVLTASRPEDPSYIAGVVEYFKIRHNNNQFLETEENLKNYLQFIHSNEEKRADILVFPESSLNNLVTAALLPEPEDNIEPCTDRKTDWADVIKQISCAAKTTKKYVVINLTEKSICPDKQQKRFNDTRKCAENSLNRYNTNVVFNRSGKVISKYRKFNLFGEMGIISPLMPESIPFTTDFGVTFGQFICFDLMFDRPALDLVQQGVTDFIFPTMWFSELPFLNAVQPQLNWAFKHNVNLLAAGASFPKIGSTGTGIYHGRAGPIRSVMSDVEISKLYVAEVPKIGSGLEPKTIDEPKIDPVDMLKLYLKRDQLDSYNTTLLQVDRAYSTELCSASVCCQFSVEVEFERDLLTSEANENFYTYRMAAFDGTRTFDGFVDGGVRVCAIFACTDKTLASCGTRFPKEVTVVGTNKFKTIKITTKYSSQDNLLVIPNTLTTSIMPLSPDYFDYQEDKVDEVVSVTMLLKKNISHLYTFAVYARDFSRDKQTPISEEALKKLYKDFEIKTGIRF